MRELTLHLVIWMHPCQASRVGQGCHMLKAAARPCLEQCQHLFMHPNLDGLYILDEI